MATLNGIDVSSHQPARIGAMVPADFVIAKATGGTWYTNPSYQNQLDHAGQSGVDRLGLYHFAHEGAKQSPVLEARSFLRAWTAAVDHVAPMVPILDWEDGDTSDVGWAAEWLRIVAEETGATPLAYMNLSVATSNNWATVQDRDVKLWLAWYLADNRIDGYRPPLPAADVGLRTVEAGWDVAVWQYTQHGRLPGYGADLDLNEAYTDPWATGRELLIDGKDGAVRDLYRP